MFRIEVHAANGGADAELFASELAFAIGRHTGMTVGREGRVVTLAGAGRL